MIKIGTKIKDLISQHSLKISLDSLKGRVILIDAYIWIYQFLKSYKLSNYQREDTTYLNGIFYRTTKLMMNEIIPVYIFDGKPNELKYNELRKRKINKLIEKRIDIEKIDSGKIDRQSIEYGSVKPYMIENTKELLTYLGLTYFDSVDDAEAQASYLLNNDIGYAFASNDYDSFLYGCPRIIRNLNFENYRNVFGKRIKNEIEFYSLTKTLERLEITREQLIDMSILIGNDYFSGIKGIGEKRAYEFIKKYGNIENIIKNETSYNYSELLENDLLNKVRDIFLNPHHIEYNVKDIKIRKGKINKDAIIELMVYKNNFSEDRISKRIDELLRKYSNKIQVRLTDFQ